MVPKIQKTPFKVTSLIHANVSASAKRREKLTTRCVDTDSTVPLKINCRNTDKALTAEKRRIRLE